MLILAVEQSTDAGSVALLDGEKILGERAWDGFVLRSSGLFTALKDLLLAVSAGLTDVSHYVVDAGPGAYGGLRVSFAAVRAFVLPASRPIYALTSAEALAFETMERFSVEKVQVVGDARRRQLWSGLYGKNGNIPLAQSSLRLIPEDEFQPAAGAMLVSPDWHRLQARLKSAAAAGAFVVEETRVPHAGFLGKLAWRKMQSGFPGELLKPVYLHAAVESMKCVPENAK
ncbi:MAG: tRNA (adenosine(37)-N6)-threonylcarbamoyltransferase complex dimerization subunit type 1 TsaB [Kiritimatiellae bacterium]|jgi:tRNA threonylcarbamoyl adenosine modification protein YeaZ|nr:tRNA (adenosine(37)-N6)-threonylcarbamoyltransferase complex dimerization subunit type 1 TsaB [Kiritimatiellia bacterium]